LLYRAPAPALGCVYPSYPWLKKSPIRVSLCFSRFARDVEMGKTTGLRLVSKRGDVVKKHPQARLRVSFAKKLQHSRSESKP
jgi:hypothetical protein